jgi:alpha-L-fucosidase
VFKETFMARLSAEEKERQKRLAWWRRAKFGMFIHWGLYSVLGRHDWAMDGEAIPPAEYELLAKRFRPKPGAPRRWARLARQAGMKYMVLTAKHHEGFCLWDTATTDYCAPRQACGRDLVAEYVQAARAEGLGVGLYFSLADWHHPDGLTCQRDRRARRRFVAYVHRQVRELCSRYGRIDILWYDYPFPMNTAGQWQSRRLNAMVRRLQPNILINDRSLRPEDFATSEQKISPTEGDRAWEACMTMNDSWGYLRDDDHWKPARQIVRHLITCARKGGNYLLNVGPRADGTVPAASVKILKQVGSWLKRNGRSIFGVEPTDATGARFFNCTARGNTLYVHCFYWPGATWSIPGLKCKVLSARFLATGERIAFTQHRYRITFSGCPAQAPDWPVTVVELRCSARPRQYKYDEIRRAMKRPGVNVSFK